MIERSSTDVRTSTFIRAVVADFGLVAAIPDPSREFHLSVAGSPYWMAPECIIGHRYNETVLHPYVVCNVITLPVPEWAADYTYLLCFQIPTQ